MILEFLLISSLFSSILLLLMLVSARNQISSLKASFFSFVEPSGEGGTQPSPLAQLSRELAKIFAQELRAQLLGSMGAIARQEKAIQGDLVEAGIAESNPLLSVILDAVPALKKRVMKNPAALPAIMNLLGGLKGKTESASGWARKNND